MAASVALAGHGAGGGVATEEEVAEGEAHAVEHADALAEGALLVGDAPEARLETLALHADGIGHGPAVEQGGLGHVEEGHAAGRGLDAAGRVDGVLEVGGGDAPLAAGHGEDALDALAVDLGTVDRGVDIAKGHAGAGLGVGDRAVDALGEALEILDHALDHALRAALAEAEEPDAAVDDLADEDDGLGRADVDGGDARGERDGAALAHREADGTRRGSMVTVPGWERLRMWSLRT